MLRTAALLLLAALPAPALAQSADADLAQQLANPVASLISLPFQNNFEWGWGPGGDGFRYTLNTQPVVPMPLNANWNLISRTILPLIAQRDVTAPGTSQTGLGDVLQSLFFSPAAPSAAGVVWGAGPVFLVPTATDRALGTGKWGIGPTAVVLRIDGQLTYGLLANHVWSFAGSSSRADVSASFLQPFISFTTRGATTYSLNTETSYDWRNEQWVVPVAASVAQLVKIGGAPVSLGGGVRWFVASPTGGPDWAIRATATLLFPR